MMGLSINQLRKLAWELKLRIPEGTGKWQLQKQIIPLFISNSSDWKKWSRTVKRANDKPMPPKIDSRVSWSPPNHGSNFSTPEKYPEKGVRVMKVKEAYLNTKEALSDHGKTSAQKEIKHISTLPSPLGQP